MNYLAHSLPFVFDDDDHAAWRVAGTSLPDWLRVIDKKARLRPDVLEGAPDDDPRFVALKAGAQQHHDDDLRFHSDDAFEALNHDVAAIARARFPHLRASTLAHVLVELLLDAALMQRHPHLLQRYYDVVASIDGDVLRAFVQRTTGRPVDNAPYFLDRFRRARFLGAYAHDDGMMQCLRGVWSRAGLGGIDDGFVDVVRDTRDRVSPLCDRFFGAAP